MIKYHTNSKGIKIAEVLPGSDLIKSTDNILDLIAEGSYDESKSINSFIRESNKWGVISFVDSLEKALG